MLRKKYSFVYIIEDIILAWPGSALTVRKERKRVLKRCSDSKKGSGFYFKKLKTLRSLNQSEYNDVNEGLRNVLFSN